MAVLIVDLLHCPSFAFGRIRTGRFFLFFSFSNYGKVVLHHPLARDIGTKAFPKYLTMLS